MEKNHSILIVLELALKRSRQGEGEASIKDIAGVIKKELDEAELKSFIKELLTNEDKNI